MDLYPVGFQTQVAIPLLPVADEIIFPNRVSLSQVRRLNAAVAIFLLEDITLLYTFLILKSSQNV